MAPRLFLRDVYQTGTYILVNPKLGGDQDNYTVEPHGSILIANKKELRRFALDLLAEVGEE